MPVAPVILILAALAATTPLRAQTGARPTAIRPTGAAVPDGLERAGVRTRVGPTRPPSPWPSGVRPQEGLLVPLGAPDMGLPGGGGCTAASVAGGVAGALVGGVIGARLERAAYDGNPEAGLTGWLVGTVAGAVLGVQVARRLCD